MKAHPSATMNTIPLSGCAPVPLAHYLKALGILRLVSESEYGDAYLRPLHGLTEQWLYDAYDGSREFRLACSVAGMRAWLGDKTFWFRQHLEPVGITANKERSWVSWEDTAANDVAGRDGDLSDALNAILARRVMRVGQAGAKGWPDEAKRFARLEDITDFIESRTNDDLLADLIWGLSLLDWQQVKALSESREAPEVIPSSSYAMLRLCFRPREGKDDAIPLAPAILHRAINGDGKAASELAVRRLRASGFAPIVNDLPVSSDIARRTAAAMLFPIAPQDFRLVEMIILKQIELFSVSLAGIQT